MRTRQRQRIPFEPLLIAPDQLNSFFGIELERQIDKMKLTELRTSTTNKPDGQSKRDSTTNYDLNVTDNSLWRTMPASQTTNELCTPMTNKPDGQSKRDSTTNYDLHATDNSLWRTMPANDEASQATGFKVFDNLLRRSMPPTGFTQRPLAPFFNRLFLGSDCSSLSTLISKEFSLEKSNAENSTNNFVDDFEEQIPISQPIPSQTLVEARKPFSLLNDSDFTYGSPAPSNFRRLSNLPLNQRPTCSVNLPKESSYLANANETTINLDKTAVSVISGNSDQDSDDLNSPAPKHIILRAKPEKKEPYLYLKPPKIVKGTDEFADDHPQLRRSKRTRPHRQLMMGEKPIYERDENGDYNLVGISQGYTADPLCKKFGTFDKDIAMEKQKEQRRRKKRVRQQNRAQRAALSQKYAVDEDGDSS